jgi:signal transduction histidine kinase
MLNNQRIELFIEAIMKVAKGDFSVQLEISEEYNDLDALAMGINMMVDDLRIGHAMGQENERIKLLNKQLHEARIKAEESDRLKSAFLANMSHEIRTPMNGILGFADLLKTPDLSGDLQQNYIRIIEKSGTRMLNIINNIVDISKIEAGLMKLDINESNVNEQIDFIHTFFKPEMKAKGLQFLIKKALPVGNANVKVDREKLYAILTNLVKNALKYTNHGRIELGYDLVEAHDRASLLQFYIKDTGIGIPKDRQEAIFERFIQADIKDISALQGAGLGLAISKSYVEMMNGNIWVESEEGFGSTFFFTLPYSNTEKLGKIEEVSLQNTPLDHINLPNSSLNILISEDDDISEMLLTKMVHPYAKRILIARTGKEVIELCRNNPDIDLILMDIQMSGMSGYEATREIRLFNNKVVIIAQTAYGLLGDREKALDSGCNDYLSKPILKEELKTAITKYFDK